MTRPAAKSTKAVETIPFDEIVRGATVRVTVIDGVQYLSIRDLIMHVCNKDGDHAGQTWRNLGQDKKEEVRCFLASLKFPGPGQSEQPVITFLGALKLIMFLPGEAAKKHRSTMASILTRYYAGDASLLREIADNAASSSPISEMARASLAAADGSGGIEDSRKRKREDLELMQLEADIRDKMMKSQAAWAQTQIEVAKFYTTLCPGEVMDERARIMFRDALLNTAGGQAAITDGDGAKASAPISISQVAAAKGKHFDTTQLQQIGRIAAKLYSEEYGKAPTRHQQLVNGKATDVNTYFEPHRHVLEAAIDAFAARSAGSAKPMDKYLRPRA